MTYQRMNSMQKPKLTKMCGVDSTGIYTLDNVGTANRYYVVSSPESLELIVKPETVGYTCQHCLLPSTKAFMQYLTEREEISNPHIFNILRGGLNFPLEEACYNIGMKVCNTDFVTCERVIKNGVITGLDIRYEKIIAEKGVTMLIGDIIASGETLMECIPLIAKRYRDLGGSIRKFVFFTIGGTKAVRLMEKLTVELKQIWPDFEGFHCIFYEGMFTVYEDKGVTGVNTPDIDFGWKGGIVAPEMRHCVMETPLALLEKCVIYDGGARRYEIRNHIEEVCDYWKELMGIADNVDFKAFVEEKMGYEFGISYSDWLDTTCLEDTESNRELWQKEQSQMNGLLQQYQLKDICSRRLQEFTQTMSIYK